MESECNVLYLYVDSTNHSLFQTYLDYVQKHNDAFLHDIYPNSGFDLFFPQTETFDSIETKMVNFNVKCEMKSYNNIEKKLQPTGFYLYPRSSMSKTTLMLANHTGIIDSGYRGYIIGAFRNLASTPVTIEKGQRLLQICSPDLRPFMITLVDEQILSITERGDGGFGSTG